jgi:ribosomal protein L11 methyltransferase
MLGAEQIDAVDIDPLAVDATRRNLALNGLASLSSVEELAQPPAGKAYDLIVANITAGILSALMPALAAATRPGGICILSGIIDSQVERVQSALSATSNQAARLKFEEIAADGEWRSIAATRPPALPR